MSVLISPKYFVYIIRLIYLLDSKLNNLEIKMILGKISLAIGYISMVIGYISMVTCSFSMSHVKRDNYFHFTQWFITILD